MKRVKPKKKRPQLKPDDYIKQTTYLHFAVMIRNLHEAFDFSKEQLEDVLEGHIALLDECNAHRNTVAGIVKDSKLITGIDAKEMADRVFAQREVKKNG